MSKTHLSVIIPVYNEEENVQPLYLELVKVLASLKKTYEVIFINDSSKDKTFEKLTEIAKKDRKIKVINFNRNYGQTAALSAGIDYSKGEIIIPMDGDLQNDPKDIPKLLRKIENGYTVVSGWRKNRKDAFIRVLPSKIANWIIKIATINDEVRVLIFSQFEFYLFIIKKYFNKIEYIHRVQKVGV